MAGKTNKILIIGGGPGGLALAQLLHTNNVPFEVFDRDPGLEDSRKGWAVALSECLPDLQKWLPEATYNEIFRLSVNHNLGKTDSFGYADATTGAKKGGWGGGAPGQPKFMLRVRREEFRAHLWNSDQLPVSSGKKFTHYEDDEDGVRAFFVNGSQNRGAVLVGADGAHSRVRQQLLGADSQLVDSVYVPIFGQSSLPGSIFEPIYEIGLMHIEPDRSRAEYYWGVMWREEDRDERRKMSDWIVHRATKQELLDKALEKMQEAGFADRLVAPVHQGGTEGVFVPQRTFDEFVPPQTLPDRRVTLIGDAAHTMIPFRAAGANLALKDACELGELFTSRSEALSEKAPIVKMLQSYNLVMLSRGRDMVLASRAAGNVEEVKGKPSGI